MDITPQQLQQQIEQIQLLLQVQQQQQLLQSQQHQQQQQQQLKLTQQLLNQQRDFQQTLLQQHQQLLQRIQQQQPPRTPSPYLSLTKRPELSRDERIEVRALHNAGWTYRQIANHYSISLRQVQYAVTTQATPRRRSGRPPLLTQQQADELIEFITASKIGRRMALKKIPQTLGWDCSEGAIRTVLRRAGYKRYIALRKPPITERTRQLRLDWAEIHKDWTIDDWKAILWSDETWVTGGRHTRTWVTRKMGEELDPTRIVERLQRKKGWMFWGCFSGLLGKGPGVFWEKDWGTITKESYCNHIVPVVDGWHRLHPGQGQLFMHDNAPAHAAADTSAELIARGIQVISWPPFSPDLNPIEKVWDRMKNYIEEHFPEHMSYDGLRAAVKEAWEKGVSEDFLTELLLTMPQRCQDVIDANGLHTRW